MNPTTLHIQTPKERFLASEAVAREWTGLMFLASSRQAIDLALLDFIQSLPMTSGVDAAASAMQIKGAIAFSRHLAMFGVARMPAAPTTASELESFDPIKAEREWQHKLATLTAPTPPTQPKT